MPEGRLPLQTVRSHDQFNTTVSALGFADGDTVDLVSEWPGLDGSTEERRAPGFRAIAFPTASGCAAAYFPETNVLVPLDHTADRSNTPASKSVVIRLEPAR